MILCCVDKKKNRQSRAAISMFPPAFNIEDITFISVVLLCSLFLALTSAERQKNSVTCLLERKLCLWWWWAVYWRTFFYFFKTSDDLINDTGL